MPKNQNLKNWLNTFEKEVLPKIKSGEKLCFIGHSLGPLFILHVVNKFNLLLDSAIFLAPFFSKLHKSWQIDLVNSSFYKENFDFNKLKKLIPVSYVLYSDNDPYVDKKHSLDFGKELDSSFILVKRAGHMNIEVNLNEFPLVLELCKTRLDLSLYQKYIAHRQELYAMEYVRERPEAMITLKPEEIMDEGVFHFNNLKHEGFCTFLGWSPNWNPEDKYYQDGRRAARRMKNFSRVYLINQLEELKRPLLLKQIDLDINGGIHVYLCPLKKIKDKVQELDFGIWDNDYVCIIKYDKNWQKMAEIILDSRHNNLSQALKWKKIIQEKAIEINNVDKDIAQFVKSNSPML